LYLSGNDRRLPKLGIARRERERERVGGVGE